MQNNLADGHIRHEFRSILNILIHFSFSLTELVSILAILGLQITLTTTQTCPYRLGIGFWTFPFLLICPLSIWLVIWRRSSLTCLIAILIHFCSTLFATAIIIVSILALIGQMDALCSTSSLNSFYTVLNGSLIGLAAFFKLFTYGEVILLYLLLRNNNNTDDASTIFIQEYHEKENPSIANIINVNVWRSWSAVTNDAKENSDIFFA